MSADLAPLVLFCYDRPDHVLKVLESIERNDLAKQTKLIIYSDGAPAAADEVKLKKIASVREVIRRRQWCAEVEIHEGESNRGLAASVISGVTEVLDRYQKVIVLEDDLVISPHFLQFMNEALDLYKKEDNVISITAYIYPVEGPLPETFFLRGADCWGWATWKRGWNLFQADGLALLKKLEEQKLERDFDFDGAYPYTQMLKDQISGKNNSWAVRWYASAFLAGKLTLYPGKSLVQNIGVDGSGTHSGSSGNWRVRLSEEAVQVLKIPVLEGKEAKERVIQYFEKLQQKPDLLRRIVNKVKGSLRG